ncbi:hypothetical protein [Ekhidna sp.]|uniref:hypothetical protein n=1 Tax=Ekhidna sp. TaxID=2608089 RepID=UPI003B50FCA1
MSDNVYDLEERTFQFAKSIRLRLILETNDQEFSNEIKTNFDETTELKKILSAIISKSS